MPARNPIRHECPSPSSRRGFMEACLAGGGLGVLALSGCQQGPRSVQGDSSTKRLKALCSNAGLQSTWCSLGRDAMLLWGDFLGVDVTWKDGEFDPGRQRNNLEAVLDEEWDFCCFQAVQSDSLREPVQRLKQRGIPVISMDTLLVPQNELREVGVWMIVTPDQEYMGRSSTQYLMDQIGGRGKVIHIGGLSGHTGAQGRARGFDVVKEKYPEVSVVGGGIRWCDWKTTMARDNFDALIRGETDPIAGAFFHSDDMALACVDAVKGTIHENMVITAVDGQAAGLEAVRNGRLAATTVNPVCLIHMTALTVGQYLVRSKLAVDECPLEIVTPGPLVSLESGNLDAISLLANPRLCLV